jgi:ABC-2 type transport system permease protein
MNSSETNRISTEPGSDSPAVTSPIRPFYWSVRREVWENRWLYIALIVVALIELFGFAISTIGMPERRRAVLLLDPARQRAVIEQPYDIAAVMMLVTVFIVGVFYCLDALYGERRERSILFWKSLPVSDLTTVLAKATIPLVIVPLLAFAIIVLTHFMMMLWSSLVLWSSGLAGTTWTRVHLIQNSLVLLYGLLVIALWHVPIYGWALLVSGWVRRATFLWAVLPLLAIGIFEKITFNTSHFASLVKERLLGFAPGAFTFHPGRGVGIDSFLQLTPLQYLTRPGLWLGLILGGAFLLAAARLRRYRGPI